MDFTNGQFPTEIITMDEKSNNANSQKGSVKSYATRVFQESTIGMVSSIVTTHSRARRVFKILLLLMCISGFLYQCITYLIHVFEYPTNVDVDIKNPSYFNAPGYTFCTNNAIKRSLFCNMYPERCYEPSAEFCKKFHSYCGTNGTTLVPKKQYYELEDSMIHDDILKYGDDLNDFFVWNRSDTVNREYPSGPYLRVKNDMSGAMICYSLHSVAENNAQPVKIEKTILSITPAPTDRLMFYIEEDEMFIPGNRPGVLLSIHSPYDSVNPFIKGIFMKPGRAYKIYIEMTEEVLLEKPFSTNCVNYEEQWEANNRTGPRIQEMCQHKCLLEFFSENFDCVAPFVLYPNNASICDENDLKRLSEIPKERFSAIADCWMSCRDDCKVTKYSPTVLERYEVDYEEDETLQDYHRYITVELFLEGGEVMTLKHSPKYLTVEVFSSIGGFIGCWLGIALMDIIDVLGSLTTVARYAWRKYRIV